MLPMNILTVSNLYPRPDQPRRGMFNAQLFNALASLGETAGAEGVGVSNICLVPEWRPWRWSRIPQWASPNLDRFETQYLPMPYVPVFGRNRSERSYMWGMDPLLDMALRCNAILTAWLYPDAAAVAETVASRGIPHWIMVLGSDAFHLERPARRKAILQAAQTARGLICVCDSLADKLVAAGIGRDKVHVARNGVDASRFHYRTKQEAAGGLSLPPEMERHIAAGAPVVLFVGNLVPVKGPDVLLKAWDSLRREPGSPGARAHLAVMGDGPMRDALERECRKRDFAASVTFLGARTHEEIALWMNLADCLCLTSRSEGMPNVVLEALASGLPVAATAVGSIPDMLKGEEMSAIAAREDATMVAAGIHLMLSSRVERKALSQRHGKRTWADQAREIVEMIATDLVANPPPEDEPLPGMPL